jgi:membrane protein DedA with SNARE-associated domain
MAMLLAACAALPDWLNHLRVFGVSISIAHFLDTYGYVVVALFIAVESTGIPFPGETMLVSASVYAAQGCGLQEPGVIIACTIGATMGDNLGFWVGRTGGRALIEKIPFVKASHLEPAERYFRKYGGATVFFGRFLAVLRAWAAFLAGVNRMRPLKFFVYNFCGAAIWSTTFGMLGYELGRNLDKLKSVLSALGFFGAVIFFVIVFSALAVYFLRRGRGDIVRRALEIAAVDIVVGALIFFFERNHVSTLGLILLIAGAILAASTIVFFFRRRASMRGDTPNDHLDGATPEPLVPTYDIDRGHRADRKLMADPQPARPEAEALQGE